MKKSGIIQGFFSVNPSPRDGHSTIKNTECNGFIRFDNYDELIQAIKQIITEEREFFSSMKSKLKLGQIIEIANREQTYEKKAEKFLELVKSD